MRKKETDLYQIYMILVTHFNMEELKSLAFRLNINFENIDRSERRATAREFVYYSYRHYKLPELIESIREMRPFIHLSMLEESNKIVGDGNIIGAGNAISEISEKFQKSRDEEIILRDVLVLLNLVLQTFSMSILISIFLFSGGLLRQSFLQSLLAGNGFLLVSSIAASLLVLIILLFLIHNFGIQNRKRNQRLIGEANEDLLNQIEKTVSAMLEKKGEK